jgi:DNA-binding response OmpR family regulator
MTDFDVPEAGAPDGAADDDVHVLFVEDDEAVAEMYKLKLELDGYAVEVAADGETAVDMAMENPPDLIFLDIRLPHMDGFQVLEELRTEERTRFVPVVVLSNYGEDELVERGFRLGALEYLIKSQTTPATVSGGVPAWVRSAMADRKQ